MPYSSPEWPRAQDRGAAGDGLLFAVQDKVWVEDPDHTPWEVYTVLADAPSESTRVGDGTCCTSADVVTTSPGSCC